MTQRYNVWATKDGRDVKVSDLTDLHLLHIIRGILEGRPFAGPGGNYQDEFRNEGHEILSQVRCNWLTVLKGEALKRGLPWDKQPTRRVGLLDFVFDTLQAEGWSGGKPNSWKELAKGVLSKNDIKQPEIDVSNLDGKPTYLHWAEGGTPLTR